MKARRLSLLLFSVAVSAWLHGPAAAQAPSESPFMPAGGVSTGAVSAPGNHELVGMITAGKQVLVGITDRTSRKSQWIPVGRTVDGIEVVSCDPKQERAVIRVNGETKTLALRSAPASTAPAVTVMPSTMPHAPGQPSAAPAPTPAGPMTKEAEQEREARMLVSDLLEIGIQQRKAYEEAQRKARNHQAGPAGPVKN